MNGLSSEVLMAAAALGIFVLAALLFWVSGRIEASTGLGSNAEIVASDTGQNRVELIEDKRLGLRGQPDYILRERVGLLRRWKLVPVELKPTRKRRTLYESDELQLVAYMVLMRSRYGRRFAGYGYVRYQDQTFTIRLTREREARLLATANAVREARRLEHVRVDSPPLPCRCGRCP